MIVLIALLLVLQYRLWFGEGSYMHAWYLHRELSTQNIKNNKIQERNKTLMAEVTDLKQGHQAIEEKARNDLGMVKSNETFYQIIHKEKDTQSETESKK